MSVTSDGGVVSVTVCATCWYASGGDATHCGKCKCCPESARIAARARRRTFRLLKVRDLTPAEMCEMEQIIAADQRDREAEERTRYESHAWNSSDDGDECVACGVTWEDCDDDCPGTGVLEHEIESGSDRRQP